MRAFLIIPMGGKGKRFTRAGYRTYKSFLNIYNGKSIFQNIITNFNSFDLEIILIGNSKILKKYKSEFRNKKIHLLHINNHNKGPIYSIYKSFNQIKEIIKNEKNIFISYCDINWQWDVKNVKKKIRNKSIIVFTHSGFHPHLEIDKKSDFCEVKNKNVKRIKEKSSFTNDYKHEFLAIGCYFIKDLNYLENFFNNSNDIFNKKREIYLVSFINFLIKKKFQIYSYLLENFVHLGTPDQYNDYNNWKSIISNSNKKINIKNSPTIMLMAGKGKRMKKFNKPKPFLKFNGLPIYRFIFEKFLSKKKIIITTKKYKKLIKSKKISVQAINQTNSLLNTLIKSEHILKKNKNYLLTSCDCFGEFNKTDVLSNNKADLIIFGFKFSNLQKKLSNSHTQLVVKSNKIIDICVKEKYKNGLLGHAGFFWIKKPKVFDYLKEFKLTKKYRQLKREALIDDYFKFLIKKHNVKISFKILNHYVHIGSEKEFEEYCYWKNFFNAEDRK